MSKAKNTLLVGAALAGLLAGTSARAFAQSTDQKNDGSTKQDKKDKKSKTEKHGCKGQNSCKGKGGCKAGDNGCKAAELLQGQRWLCHRRFEATGRKAKGITGVVVG